MGFCLSLLFFAPLNYVNQMYSESGVPQNRDLSLNEEAILLNERLKRHGTWLTQLIDWCSLFFVFNHNSVHKYFDW